MIFVLREFSSFLEVTRNILRKDENKVGLARKVGEIIRADRKAMGLSLEELAKKVEIGVATLHRIETGATSPSLDLILKIAAQIHRPVATFFEKSDEDYEHRKSNDIEVIKTENYSYKVISPFGLIHPKIAVSHFRGRAGTSYDTQKEGYIQGYVWVYVLKGKLVVEYDSKIHAVNEGDVLFCSGRKPQVVKALADSEFLYALTKEKGNNLRRANASGSVKRNIREMIRADRKAMGLSLEQLAKKVGIGVATLQRIETGATSPSLDLLIKIAIEVHRPVATFFRKGDEDIDLRKSEEIEVIETEKNYSFKVIAPYGLIHPDVLFWDIKAKAGSYSTQGVKGHHLVYLLKGQLVIDYEGKVYAINEGDVFFCDVSKQQRVTIIEDSEIIYSFIKV